MLTKEEIIDEAKRLKFADIGFTGAEPFGSQKDYLLKHQEEYGWAEAIGLGLLAGTDPRNILPAQNRLSLSWNHILKNPFRSRWSVISAGAISMTTGLPKTVWR